jgi:multidrug efflux pump subunit AcrB
MTDPQSADPKGIIPAIVKVFLGSKFSLIFIIMALCLGAAALFVTPKEEEPQIVVPMADIYVNAPGASPREIEQLVSIPLERFLWQLDGVEYVYSISQKDMAVVTVRFFVGEDREDSLIKLQNRISMHIDQVTPIIENWVIKPIEIDDVPIVTISLFSDQLDDAQLHRTGQEALARLSRVENTSRTVLHGGRPREIRVELDPEKMTGYGISYVNVQQALQEADFSVNAGDFSRSDTRFPVTTTSFMYTAGDVKSLVVGIKDQIPVYLRDIAHIQDIPRESETYTAISFSNAYAKKQDQFVPGKRYPAVTLAVSKKKGANAVAVAKDIIAEFKRIHEQILPHGVYYQITRNYGETAAQKVWGLVTSLGFAIASVVILLAFALGWREALIVAVAVPISFSLALFVNYLFGYTINRVTLFALILSLGLVVDDPITNVENIQRHIKMGILEPFKATLAAVDEVLPPVIMSTLAIIVCFVPLFFITGMMGPYMAPMAVNVPLTVTFSTLSALTIVPWLTLKLLRSTAPELMDQNDPDTASSDRISKQSRLFRIYRSIVQPFLDSGPKRTVLFVLVFVLLLISCSLALFRLVPLKLLPFDNKNEFQIVIDMPEGTTLERTHAVVQDFENFLKTVPEITSMVSYTGDASPMDFNGMVRHYYLRKAANLADIRVNLTGKDVRDQQSHAIVLRLRNDLEAIARKNNAKVKLVEVPPGPPVLSTLVGELYADADVPYDQLIQAADHLKKIMEKEAFVVDIDDMAQTLHERIDFIIDKEKAALHGISTRQITTTLQGMIQGMTPAHLHLPRERNPLYIRVIMPRKHRSGIVALTSVPLRSKTGSMVPLAELVHVQILPNQQPIYHKNLDRVVYVLADTAGRAPAEAILDMQKKLEKDPLPSGIQVNWAGEGEWKITIRVFRDMGIAFAAALIGIYILLVIQSGSFFMPVLIMMAIPLTLLGIMPGFLVLNLVAASPVDGFSNPIFFTATSMIGMIALGGIVIRNALVLIEFIQASLKQGMELKEAILQSGAIRMRPILLTALTTAIGAFPITLDPVFSGLAWALIFGLAASTLFTLVLIPVAYYSVYHKSNAS